MTMNSSLLSTMVRQDVYSDATLRQYKIVVEVYVVGTLCVVGIAGNALSIAVLGRDQTNRRTTGFMLQMLAVADAVYLVCCLFYQTLNCAVKWTDWLPEAVRRGWPYVEVYAWPMASMAQTATVWLVVVLTADRYIAICRPLHAAQYSTVSRVRSAVATVWIVAALYNLPRFFERVVVVDVSANSTSPTVTSSLDLEPSTTSPQMIVDGGRATVQRTAMREDALYVFVYKTCLFFVVRFLIPFTALAFFNQRLIAAMRASDQMRQRSASGAAKERQHTWTLVVVVVVFVVCELLDLTTRALNACRYYAPDRLSFPLRQLVYAVITSNLMLTVNSCINFVIYCFMGRRFRLCLMQMIGCSRRTPERYGETLPTVHLLHARTLETAITVVRGWSSHQAQPVSHGHGTSTVSHVER